MHAPDCALVLYASVDPATLKQPLACDCEEGDAPPGLDPVDDTEGPPAAPRQAPRQAVSPKIVLTGAAASSYVQLRCAETELQAAQKRKDEALKAFLDAVTG